MIQKETKLAFLLLGEEHVFPSPRWRMDLTLTNQIAHKAIQLQVFTPKGAQI